MTRRSHLSHRFLHILVSSFAVVALWGCPSPDEVAEDFGEPQKDIESEVPGGPEGPSVEEGEEIVEKASGSFELTLEGDISNTFEGTAVCTFDNVTQELEAALTPGREAPYRFFVRLPEFVGTDTYKGTFEVTGQDTSLGRVDVGATRVEGADVVKEPGLRFAVRGTYQDGAGAGQVEGEIRCDVPDGTDEQGSVD